MSFVPAQKTIVAPKDILPALAVAWKRYYGNEPFSDSVCILGSQWAIETARGTKMMNFNCAGIKASADQDHTFYTTHERLNRATAQRFLANSSAAEPCELAEDKGEETVVVRFKPNHPVCRFRAYENLGDGCFDYVALLARRFALSWPAVLTGDPAAFSKLLRKQGYYTGNEADYTRMMVALFSEMKKLYVPPPPPETLPTGVTPYSLSAEGIVEATLQRRDEDDSSNS